MTRSQELYYEEACFVFKHLTSTYHFVEHVCDVQNLRQALEKLHSYTFMYDVSRLLCILVLCLLLLSTLISFQHDMHAWSCYKTRCEIHCTSNFPSVTLCFDISNPTIRLKCKRYRRNMTTTETKHMILYFLGGGLLLCNCVVLLTWRLDGT